MSPRRIAAPVCAALTLAGCGGAVERDAAEDALKGAEVRVTRDFGERRLAARRVPRVRRGDTVLRVLDTFASVETSPRGSGVRAIEGVEAGAGARWSYFVNGFGSRVPADRRSVDPGDVVQWDLRSEAVAPRVPAVVGAYPEPFLSGVGDRRLPARVECEDDRGAACREAKRRLSAAGVPAAGAPLGVAAGPGVLRVVVARWSVARTVKAATGLEAGPAQSGVFARFAPDGRALDLLDASGRAAQRAPAGTGLVAATLPPGQRPVWLVTGLDQAGVDRGVAALEPRTLRDAYAVAATPGGPVRLPVRR